MSYRYPRSLSSFTRLSAALFFLPVLSHAVTWDGNGTSDSSGTWEFADNWSPDGVPLSGETAVLGDVTSGTRTVTISSGSPQTVTNLTMVQTTVGAVNKLSVEDDLTISSSSAPLTTTATAGAGSIVIDIAAGKTLSAHRAANSTTTFGGTLNLLGSGSVFQQSSTGILTASFSGPITAAAGSSLRSVGTSAHVALSGASTFGAGSNILLQFSTNNGSATFTNNSTLVMDGAMLTYDWATLNSPSNGTRNYSNTGTWTLQNASSVTVISSTGVGSTNGGNAMLVGNTNSGTLNVESGSILTSRSLTNTGTIKLGSSTLGVSDQAVTMGGLIDFNTELNNGTASGSGTVNIRGNATFGRSTPSTSNAAIAIFRNGGAGATGSLLDIGDGVTETLFTISHSNAELNNAAGNTVNVNANATLRLASVQTGNQIGNAILTNAGSMTQAGTIQFRSTNQNSGNRGTRTFNSTGTHVISGTNAVIEALTNSGPGGSALPPSIVYTNSGVLSGATADDKLAYVNSTGVASLDTLTLTMNGGQITAGNGTGGAGVSSIGSLAFENVNLSLNGAVTLGFDIGGTVGSGLYDSLSLTGDGAVLALGSNGILDIRLVNGFSPAGGTYLLANATSITGTFSSLLFNGSAAGETYSVNYGADNISITFSAIPEPSAYAVLAGLGALGLTLVARRAKRS